MLAHDGSGLENREQSFKNADLLKVVLADGGKCIPHRNMVTKDQTFWEVF